ncbi:MAG: hypothetical protein KF914_15100 [Rhizobiaceae bacterium]|nr:hypothetical protein [Rhizobiaceae bacterium]
MDKTPLVGPDFAGGRELIDKLELVGLPIAFAGWLNLREVLDWQLYIASPDVQTFGPTIIIKIVDKVLIETHSSIPLQSIDIVNTSNHFVNRIPETYSPADRFYPTRVRGMAFDDGDIVEGFIYKIDKATKPSTGIPKLSATMLKRVKSMAA